MFEHRKSNKKNQPQFWIETRKLPKVDAGTFYRKRNASLEKIGLFENLSSEHAPSPAAAPTRSRCAPCLT